MQSLEQLEILNKDINLNTSYPLSPLDWQKYKTKNFDIFKNINDFSMYIHIPFCKHLCKFCEYSKCKKQENTNEDYVIDTIINDIKNFKKPNLLYGFDIGGGTPTCLSDENFKKIVSVADKIILSSNKPDNFIASIEGTFDTLSDTKIEILKNSQFKRISLGIQVFKESFLKENGRTPQINLIKEVIKKINKDFVVNIDLMYGLNNITKKDLEETIKFVNTLNVQQITLYEMRYNMVDSKPAKEKDEIISEYDFCFDEIIKLGFKGRYGRNTFTKLNDEGVSSYLYYRMQGYFYKGFGPSAQSMTNTGITYNLWKNSEKFSKEIDIKNLLDVNTYENGDVYKLPKAELSAKMICISLYQCMINLKNLEKFYNNNLLKTKKEIVDFLLKEDLIKINKDNLYITKKGYKYYSVIGYLLYN